MAVVLLAIAGAVLGAQYNVLSQLNLPSIPINGQTATTAAIVAGIAALLVVLLAPSSAASSVPATTTRSTAPASTPDHSSWYAYRTHLTRSDRRTGSPAI